MTNMTNMDFRDVDVKYAYLIKECLEYVLNVRRIHPEEEIIDIIMTFCFEKNIDSEEMGDAISQDEYFKQLVKLDVVTVDKEESNLDLEDW